jgi:hypothetical protein
MRLKTSPIATTNRKIVLIAWAFLLAMGIPGHSSAQNALRCEFNMAASGGNGYYYAELTGPASYIIVAGDYLVYDVCWVTAGNIMTAVDFQGSTGSLRDGPPNGAVDQNGIDPHPGSDLSVYAYNKWYHRVINWPAGCIGNNIYQYDISCERDDDVTVVAYFDKIYIMNGTTVKLVIWDSNSTWLFSGGFWNPTPNPHVLTATEVLIPTLTGTTPGSRCGTGTVTLGATPSAGTARWWDAATGGTLLFTGNSFTTPSISATTTYYAEAFSGCPSKDRTAVVATVQTPSTIVFTSGTQNPTLCAGTAIPTTVYTFGGSATNATVTNLPAGLSSSVNTTAKTVTISGTPTTGGTYTITTSGHLSPCTAATIQGTVTRECVYDYSSSTSFTAPPCVTSVKVECWGAGGGGARDNTSGATGNGGGGGGAYARVNTFAVTPGNSYPVNVGTGGSSTQVSPATAGTNSSFNTTTCVAAGGSPGTEGPAAGPPYTPGNGGTGGLATNSTGDVKFSGGTGATGLASNGGGGGGSAGTGSAGNPGSGAAGGAAVTGGGTGGNGGSNLYGLPGNSPGGGGGGAESGQAPAYDLGGSGANGLVRITFTPPSPIVPVITPGSTPEVCQGTTTASLAYSTTGCPDLYKIDYADPAFADVPYSSLPVSPIPLTLPSGAAAGTYNATLTVKNSFFGLESAGTPFTVKVNALPTATVSGQSNISCYAGINGSITITAGGGTGPYKFSIHNGGATYVSGSNPYTFSGLTAGTYYPRVMDTNGCESPSCP